MSYTVALFIKFKNLFLNLINILLISVFLIHVLGYNLKYDITYNLQGHIFIIIIFTILCLLALNYLVNRNLKLKFQYNIIDIFMVIIFLYNISGYILKKAELNTFILIEVTLIIYYFTLKQLYVLNINGIIQYILLLFYLIQGIIQALFGLFQFTNLNFSFLSSFSIIGTFQNSGPYAIFISSVLPLSICIYFNFKNFSPYGRFKIISRIVSIVSIILILIIIPITNSRPAWISAICGLTVIAYYHFRVKIKLNKFLNTLVKKISFILLTIFIILLIGFILYAYKENSALGRVFIWKVSLNAILLKPWLGHGLGSFVKAYHESQAQYFLVNPYDTLNVMLADKIRYAFNDYIQLAVEKGVIGLFLFLSLILVVINKTIISGSFIKLNRLFKYWFDFIIGYYNNKFSFLIFLVCFTFTNKLLFFVSSYLR